MERWSLWCVSGGELKLTFPQIYSPVIEDCQQSAVSWSLNEIVLRFKWRARPARASLLLLRMDSGFMCISSTRCARTAPST